MSGTDTSKAQPATVTNGAAPTMILVRPQLAENIGMVARAMLNCALGDLRLVAPNEPARHERAIAASSGANIVLENSEDFPDTRAAIADCQWVLATTARRRASVGAGGENLRNNFV